MKKNVLIVLGAKNNTQFSLNERLTMSKYKKELRKITDHDTESGVVNDLNDWQIAQITALTKDTIKRIVGEFEESMSKVTIYLEEQGIDNQSHNWLVQAFGFVHEDLEGILKRLEKEIE